MIREEMKMELEHIAFTITDYNEIKHFYHEILGMKVLRSFSLVKLLVGISLA